MRARRRRGKTVIRWVDRVQTRTFLGVGGRIRITALHPYINGARSGHAAAIVNPGASYLATTCLPCLALGLGIPNGRR